MANPTTNYGFVLPTSGDLVTDLPADFDVALQGVDTRLKALQPGTTLGDLAYSSATANTNTRLPVGTNGQVLAVVAGVPAWQNGTTGDIEGVTAGTGISGGGTSGTVTVTNSMATAMTTKGDIVVATGSGTFVRQGVGTNGQVLTADSAQADGVIWSTPASGAVLQVVNATSSTAVNTTSSTFVDSNLTVTITPTSVSNRVMIMVSSPFKATYAGNSCLGIVRLYRGATALTADITNVAVNQGSGTETEHETQFNMIYIDSPATTSATTYKIQMRSSGGRAIISQSGNSIGSIIAMEVTP